ncbi:hypothetical protein [Pseudomonas sp.]|uniref:hypothetical protein n=1 Tax=Pseudomonas sp. TaxID=306 RepID=UPI00299F4773|nr:hypothetical protein [Pseudomonas sp.]MDX1366239.1 hypothetical protein [Pseudomonas sp.]
MTELYFWRILKMGGLPWQFQVLYNSPLAMQAGTLGAQKPAIAGQAYPVAHNHAGEMPMPGTAGMFG